MGGPHNLMWSDVKIKTKITKRRVERKVNKKRHNLIRCKCQTCGKKKWSQYNKKGKKVLSLIVLNTVIWFLTYQIFVGFENEVLVFENPKVAVVHEESLAEGEAQSKSVGSDRDDTLAKESQKQTLGSPSDNQPSSVRASSVETQIHEAFGKNGKLAVAVAKAESSLRSDAKGWNCYYWYNSKRYSGACKPDDRHKAWSVDCGIFQINVKGQECPTELYDVKHNIKVAKSMSESERGWKHWWTYNTGKYLKFLS